MLDVVIAGSYIRYWSGYEIQSSSRESAAGPVDAH